MRAIIFNRASRDTSGRAKSVMDQNKDNHQTAKLNGWEVVSVFTENNIGASKYSKKKRSEYKKMLDFLQAGKADVLVCWEGSRNDRTLKGHVELSGLLQDTDTKLCIGGRLLDLNDDDDEFFAGLDALLNVKEAARLRKRTLRGVKSNAIAGKPHTRPPYGYKLISKGVWALDPVTVPVVQEMYKWIAKGGSGTSLAKDLNKREIPVPQWKIPFVWKEWSYTQVKQLLINPAYISKRVYRGEVIGDATWPALLDEETYWTVYNKLTDESRKTYREGGINHLCSGQVTSCGVCSSRLRFHTIKKIQYYMCAGSTSCVSMKYETLNSIVQNRVTARLGDPHHWAQVVAQATNRDAEVREARAELERLKSELNDARSLIKAKQLSVKSFSIIEMDLQVGIEDAKRRASVGINPLLEEAQFKSSEVFNAWTLEQKREAINTLYEIKLLPNPKGKRLAPEDRVKFIPKGLDT